MKNRVQLTQLLSRGADVVKGEVQWSDEHRRFLRTGRCPTCGKGARIRGPRYLRPDETEMSEFSARLQFMLFPEGTLAQCRSCGARWPLYANGSTQVLEPPRSTNLQIIETERSFEHDHTDPLELDNLGGTSLMKHTVTLTQEWTQTLVVDTEKSNVEDATAGVDIPGLGTFSRKTEEALKSRYAITEQTRKLLTREFSFEVPPRTKRVVSFNYSRVWQHGLARVTNENGAIVEMPFRVAVDMTVNLAATDTTA